MLAAITVVIVLTLLLVSAGLALFAGYRWRDLLVLWFLATIALYLSRFDQQVQIPIHDRTYVALHAYLLGVAAALGLLRWVARQTPRLGYTSLFVLLSLFAMLAVVSGLVNRAVDGFSSAVYVLVVVLLPLIVAALLVDCIPRGEGDQRRLRVSFILVIGVLTSSIVVGSAIAPNLFGEILGWSTLAASRQTGFVRGWSPLGGPIASGILLVFAYGLAMHEVIGGRRRRYIAVLLLVGTALLFTLARSVMAMWLLFHIVYFWSAIRRHTARVLGLIVVVGFLSIPLLWQLQPRYSFERFFVFGGKSTELRASSARAALAASVKNPILGQGPGLLYEEIRRSGPVTAGGGARRWKTTVVADQISALEPHNLYLLLAAEHGWIALALFVGLLILIWRRIRIRSQLLGDHDRSVRSALNALWISTFVMLLTSSAPLVNPQVAVFFWFFAFTGLHWRETILRAGTHAHPEASFLISPNRRGLGSD